QAGYVGAGNQQDEQHRCEKNQDWGTDIPDKNLTHGPQYDAETVVCLGVSGGEPGRDAFHLRASALQADAWRKAADDSGIAAAAPIHRLIRAGDPEADGDEHVDGGDRTETRREHSDDGETAAIQGDAAANDILQAAEMRLPKRMTQHCYKRCAALVFGRVE